MTARGELRAMLAGPEDDDARDPTLRIRGRAPDCARRGNDRRGRIDFPHGYGGNFVFVLLEQPAEVRRVIGE